MGSIATALFVADLPAFIYYAVKRDGKPTQHTLTREQARAAVERYNRALLERAKRGLPLPTADARHDPRISLAPYGLGVAGRF